MSFNSLFSDSRRLLPTWFGYWIFLLMISLLLGAGGLTLGYIAQTQTSGVWSDWKSLNYIANGPIMTSIWSYITFTATDSFIEKKLPFILVNLSWLLLLVISFADMMVYLFKMNRPVKKAACSLVFDGDEDYLGAAKKQLRNIFIVNFLTFFFVLLSSFWVLLKHSFFNNLIYKKIESHIGILNWTKLVKWDKGAYAAILVPLLSLIPFFLLISLALKFRFRKCIEDCFCFYRNKNLWFFFNEGNETTKSWLMFWNVGFFISIAGLVGFFVGFFIFSKKALKDPSTQAGIGGAFMGMIMCFISIIEYLKKEKRTIKMALKHDFDDEETITLKKLNNSLNLLVSVTSFTKIVSGGSLGALLWEFITSSSSAEAKDPLMIVVMSCSIAMLIGWLLMGVMQIQVKRQFTKIRKSEDVQLGANLNF